MYKIVLVLLMLAGTVQAQFQPTSAKTKFVNGIAIGSRDTSAFAPNDSLVITIARDSVMYYRYKGYWKPIGSGAFDSTQYVKVARFLDSLTAVQGRIQTKQPLLGYVPISPSDTASMLANRLKISDTSSMLSPYARTSNLPSLTPYKLFNDTLFTNGYTTRGTTKKVIDSIAALKLNISDTASMMAAAPRVNRFLDSILSVRTLANTKGSGTVTSIATNSGSGITGGTITSTGTLAADTGVLSTKANVTALLLGKQNTLTNPVTGTGVNGRVAFWNGTNTQGSSSFLTYDNTNQLLQINSGAGLVLYPSSGTNQSTVINNRPVVVDVDSVVLV